MNTPTIATPRKASVRTFLQKFEYRDRNFSLSLGIAFSDASLERHGAIYFVICEEQPNGEWKEVAQTACHENCGLTEGEYYDEWLDLQVRSLFIAPNVHSYPPEFCRWIALMIDRQSTAQGV